MRLTIWTSTLLATSYVSAWTVRLSREKSPALRAGENVNRVDSPIARREALRGAPGFRLDMEHAMKTLVIV